MTTELVEEKVRETLHAVVLDGVRAPDDLAARVLRRRARRRVRQMALAAAAVAVVILASLSGLGTYRDGGQERTDRPATVPDGWHPWSIDSDRTAGNGCVLNGDDLYCKGYRYDAVKFDARTGEQQWTLKVHGEGGAQIGRPLAVRDGVLFIYRNHTAEKGPDGGYRPGTDLVGVDTGTGRVLWSFEMYDDNRSDERAMLIDGAVLVNTPGRVWSALDPRTGEKKWSRTWEKGLWCQGSVLDGTPYLLCTRERDRKDDTDVYRLDAATGVAEKVATVPGKQHVAGTTPDALVLAALGAPPEPGSDAPWDTTYTTVDAAGKQTGHKVRMPGPMHGIGVIGDDLVTLSEKGVASAVSLTTGETRWSVPTGIKLPESGFAYAPAIGYRLIAAHDDVVYFFSATGDLAGHDARTGEQLWRHHVDTKWPSDGVRDLSMPQLLTYGDVLIAREGAMVHSLLPDLGK
ncbi:PQQ-binding-like beta-propeller repeat protein [Streptomyces sp. NPDC050418]|uniref:outer membrane protein assembly factor BamB family protein n=1 Tax=Streptomyces sp. NPDC050418 TaxID=3365612 RepID=UPI0037AFD4BC